jgi:hypothetical protein
MRAASGQNNRNLSWNSAAAPIEAKNNPDDHVTLVSLQPSSEEDFVSRLQGAMTESVRRRFWALSMVITCRLKTRGRPLGG